MESALCIFNGFVFWLFVIFCWLVIFLLCFINILAPLWNAFQNYIPCCSLCLCCTPIKHTWKPLQPNSHLFLSPVSYPINASPGCVTRKKDLMNVYFLFINLWLFPEVYYKDMTYSGGSFNWSSLHLWLTLSQDFQHSSSVGKALCSAALYCGHEDPNWSIIQETNARSCNGKKLDKVFPRGKWLKRAN